MNASEYRAALKTLSLSQEAAAELVGANPRTGQRWALGERAVPPPMATLIRLLLKRPELIAVIRDECDPKDSPSKSRKR